MVGLTNYRCWIHSLHFKIKWILYSIWLLFIDDVIYEWAFIFMSWTWIATWTEMVRRFWVSGLFTQLSTFDIYTDVLYERFTNFASGFRYQPEFFPCFGGQFREKLMKVLRNWPSAAYNEWLPQPPDLQKSHSPTNVCPGVYLIIFWAILGKNGDRWRHNCKYDITIDFHVTITYS